MASLVTPGTTALNGRQLGITSYPVTEAKGTNVWNRQQMCCCWSACTGYSCLHTNLPESCGRPASGSLQLVPTEHVDSMHLGP